MSHLRVRRRRCLWLLLGALVFNLAPQHAGAQLKTIVTDHFRIHFFPGAQGTAQRVAEVAEEVFPPMAAAFDYYDEFHLIHIVVVDNSDVLGNAAASYYSNTIFFWATNLDTDLRGTTDYRNTLTHELAHIMTLNKARKKWPFYAAVFSVSRSDENPDISFSIPLLQLNAPRGLSEGVAQLASHQFGYDTWDAHRDMILRMAVLEEDLLTYAEMGTVGNRDGKYYGELLYNQGYAMMLYVREQFGNERAEALFSNAGMLTFDTAIRRVLGISAVQLYDDWLRHITDQYDQQAAEIRSQGLFEGRRLEDLDQGVLEYYPSFSPDGKRLAFVTSEKRDYPVGKLVIYDFVNGTEKRLEGYVDSRISWNPGKSASEIVFVRNKNGFNDLYIYDLKADHEKRISANLRARDPAFSPDGKRILFVHNADGTNNIGVINRDGTGRVYLTNNNDATQYWAPQFSPDGEWILFNVYRGEDRDIAVIRADSPPRPKTYGFRADAGPPRRKGFEFRQAPHVPDSVAVFPDSLAFPSADTSGFRALLASRADERDPHWLPDGSGFLFSSDHTGVFNIYRYNMEDGRVNQVTNVIGGAFGPTVGREGQVVYAGYHASDHSLYEIGLKDDYGRRADFMEVAERDYQTVFQGPNLTDEYSVSSYTGRNVVSFLPILSVGPTFVGNSFGLNQVSAGMQVSTGEMLGGEDLTAWAIGGENFKAQTDINTDIGLYYERSLRPQVAGSQSFNPSFFLAYRRREINNLVKGETTTIDTMAVGTLFPVPADTADLLIPDAEQHFYQLDNREDRFKDIFATTAVGINLPLTRRQEFQIAYRRNDYNEDWHLQLFRNQFEVFVVQNGVDITHHVAAELTRGDTTQVNRDNPQPFFRGLDFYTSHDLSISWTYRFRKIAANRLLNPQGRLLALVYRNLNPTLVDSLTQLDSIEGSPRDLLGPSKRRFRVNEFIAFYNERLGLPFDNGLSLEVFGAYRDIVLKERFSAEGGIFVGAYYWPMRYFVGGRNFLSGYPYFTAWGSKLIYARTGYSFPLWNRINKRFFNFTFSRLQAEMFAEAGAVGNFAKLDLRDFGTNAFLSDVGAELRLLLFTFERIPMYAYFQVAHPLNRDRVPLEPDDEPLDKRRYYFGFTL